MNKNESVPRCMTCQFWWQVNDTEGECRRPRAATAPGKGIKLRWQIDLRQASLSNEEQFELWGIITSLPIECQTVTEADYGCPNHKPGIPALADKRETAGMCIRQVNASNNL